MIYPLSKPPRARCIKARQTKHTARLTFVTEYATYDGRIGRDGSGFEGQINTTNENGTLVLFTQYRLSREEVAMDLAAHLSNHLSARVSMEFV